MLGAETGGKRLDATQTFIWEKRIMSRCLAQIRSENMGLVHNSRFLNSLADRPGQVSAEPSLSDPMVLGPNRSALSLHQCDLGSSLCELL